MPQAGHPLRQNQSTCGSYLYHRKKTTSVVFLETFIQLPHGARVIKDGAGQEMTVRTFLGHADIRTMRKDRFQANILDVTGQQAAVNLHKAEFTMTGAFLDEDKIQESLRESRRRADRLGALPRCQRRRLSPQLPLPKPCRDRGPHGPQMGVFGVGAMVCP